jgi:5-methylcytosine-specific restriction protein A
MIDKAINFIISNVHNPALSNPNLSKKIKNKVQSSKTIITNFKKVGDLYLYLKRFSGDKHGGGGKDTFDEMNSLGLETLETIFSSFEDKFEQELNDFTVLSDFTVGETYTSFDIAIFAKTYNVLPGIYLIGKEPKFDAIFSKVTLGSDKGYPNEWIKEGLELKHYLEAQNGNISDQNIKFKRNKAILNSAKNSTPVYVFIKNGKECYLEGLFKYKSLEKDESGARWFRLVKTDLKDKRTEITLDAYIKELEQQVEASKNSSKEDRQARLKNASKKPQKQKITVSGYKRNPDVIAEVLDRANGVCEGCKELAPFTRSKDNSPYLEVHHIIHLANDGEDTVENAIALCPNCHRNRHFGIDYKKS